MFSTNQLEIVKSFVPTMRAKGYNYYIAYTSTDTSNSWNNSVEPDLYFIFSKDKITANSGYSYNIPENSVQYVCRSSNFSTSTSANNTERFVKKSFSGTLKIDVYEHIYSNAEYGETVVAMPDILGGEIYAESVYLQATNFILGAFLFFIVIWQMWKTRK